MIKPVIYMAAAAVPAAASNGYEIASACAGGAVISAIMKYRDASKAKEDGSIAVADAVLAAIAGMTVGWFARDVAIFLALKSFGIALSPPLAALIMSLLGIKIVEFMMTRDISNLLPWGKKT